MSFSIKTDNVAEAAWGAYKMNLNNQALLRKRLAEFDAKALQYNEVAVMRSKFMANLNGAGPVGN